MSRMGTISDALEKAALSAGVKIITGATVTAFEQKGNKITGVRLQDGSMVSGGSVISNLTPYQTVGLIKDSSILSSKPDILEYTSHLTSADYGCGAFKINLAVDSLPNFLCAPNHGDEPGPQHRGTIHFENSIHELEIAASKAQAGIPADRPVIEMTIPSSQDTTVAPPGQHVVQLFVQYAPYNVDPQVGSWKDETFKEQFIENVFAVIEEFAPGFRESILYIDALSPLDLETEFALHKGNIFHGALGLHQIGWARPMMGWANHRTPIEGLYLCGAGTHPGGGVTAATGRNCAQAVSWDLGLGMVK
ncbi:hypothetical protein AAMO2058_000583500 [Amorphochlora amoebiformis]